MTISEGEERPTYVACEWAFLTEPSRRDEEDKVYLMYENKMGER